MRLYPVQAEDEYPLKAPVMMGSSEKNVLMVLPCAVEAVVGTPAVWRERYRGSFFSNF